ncbi:VCBS repeat-containing protein [Marinoscillum luteum]|uniref:VCBS repeat-containing protein n=1 Tax=Marinoscillum luteum TaxID=861051 RepID=A0ABW7NBV2_9BACT
MMSIRTFCLLILIVSVVSCKEQVPKSLLEYVPAETSGVSFSNTLTEDEQFNIVDYLYFYNGGGVAVGDINNDGLEDIYFTANQAENKLYLNKGNFEFEDITESAGVSSPGAWKTGVTMADVNADGYLDIYVCRVGKYKGISGQNQLFINNGDLTFTESAASFGLDFKGFSTQAAFFDFDNDQDLDVYLLNHSVHTKRSYGRSTLRLDEDSLAGDLLLRNDGGMFVDVTKSAGIYTSQIGYGLGIGLSDFNFDGYTDIYISNDFHENDYLYLNNQDGTFTESIGSMITHSSRSSMGNDIGDINNDGLPEIITLDMLPEDEKVLKNSAGEESYEIYKLKQTFGYEKQFARNMLQLNNGDGTFSEVGLMTGVAATDWSWAPLFADLDLDGYKDLFISNGIVKRPNDLDYIMFLSANDFKVGNDEISDSALIAQMPDGKVENYLFRNQGGISFENVSASWAKLEKTVSTSSVYADLDNDGDLDLVVNNINDRAQILKNNQQGNNYLKVRLKGSSGNPNGVGTKVRLYAEGNLQYQELFPDRGFQSSTTKELVFGVGKSAKVDSLRVIWPGGGTQMLTAVEVNQTILLDMAQAKGLFEYEEEGQPPVLKEVTEQSQLAFRHFENPFVDFNAQYLIPHVISRDGPAIAVADVNGDGLEDAYICGASGNNGMLYLQNADGTFRKHSAETFRSNPAPEETAALFFDADNDGDQDLYLASGGNEFQPPNPRLNDRLFYNDGAGNFSLQQGALEENFQHGSVVIASDIDHDGDQDLFVGGRVVAGKYGQTPESRILFNIGPGRFRNETAGVAPELEHIGMVTDAVWADLDEDGYEDLIIVGEWMPITVFMNRNGKLEKADIPDLDRTNGWWNTITLTDLNGDGRPDFVLGNLGTNSKLQPSVDQPVRMYVNDFDKNLSLDQIITYSIGDKEYPLANRDELVKQMPLIKKLFILNKDFSGKSIDQIFQPEALSASKRYEACTYKSIALMNLGGLRFEQKELPAVAQRAPVYAIASLDVNNDGNQDLILGGNMEWATPYFGAYDASQGALLLGNGQGEFSVPKASEAGLKIRGDIRSLAVIQSAKGSKYILVGRNDDVALVFSY